MKKFVKCELCADGADVKVRVSELSSGAHISVPVTAVPEPSIEVMLAIAARRRRTAV